MPRTPDFIPVQVCWTRIDISWTNLVFLRFVTIKILFFKYIAKWRDLACALLVKQSPEFQ